MAAKELLLCGSVNQPACLPHGGSTPLWCSVAAKKAYCSVAVNRPTALYRENGPAALWSLHRGCEKACYTLLWHRKGRLPCVRKKAGCFMAAKTHTALWQRKPPAASYSTSFLHPFHPLLACSRLFRGFSLPLLAATLPQTACGNMWPLLSGNSAPFAAPPPPLFSFFFLAIDSRPLPAAAICLFHP